MLKRLELFNTNRPLDVILNWDDNGYLILDPPYQRGDVWGPIRRVNLIKSLMMAIPIPSVVINDRSKTSETDFGYAVIDGKQRLTTILMFFRDQFSVPGDWFGVAAEQVRYSELPVEMQRRFKNRGVAIAEGALASVEDEQTVFELVNFGGVPQGSSDI